MACLTIVNVGCAMNEWITIETYDSKMEADKIVLQLSAQGVNARVVKEKNNEFAPNFCVSQGYKVQVMDDSIGDIENIINKNHLAS